MEKIYEKQLTEHWLEKSGLTEQFDTEGLDFFLIRYEQGEFLSEQGQPIEQFQFVVSGDVVLYYLDEDGERRNVGIMSRNGLLGDMEFVVGSVPVFYSEAVTPVTVIALAMEKNRARLERDCRFLMHLLRQASQVKMLTARNQIVLPGLKERLLYHLRYECPHQTMKGMDRTAAQLRCSRRQLQRVVKALEGQGRLVKRERGCYQLRGSAHNP